MTRRDRSRFAAGLVVATCLAVPRVDAWGERGHRIVARIAARNLSPSTRTKLALILNVPDARLETAMAAASTWPDEIDKLQTGTRDWHFIDVPITAPFATTGLCPQHACVVDQIQEMCRRLRTNATGFALAAPPVPPRPMASQELAFLIHFVGDIHQPLHAATDGDRGGNCVNLKPPIEHPDGSTTTDLHAFWDVDEVLAVIARQGGDEAKTAAALFQQFKSDTPVPQKSVGEWAREANQLARTQVYTKLALPSHTAQAGRCASNIAPLTIRATYVADTVSTAERQLLRAGIRLSNVLNAICAGSGCSASAAPK